MNDHQSWTFIGRLFPFAILLQAAVLFGAGEIAPASAQGMNCIKPPCGRASVTPPAVKNAAKVAFPSGKADFVGEFRISYSPVYCVRTPCPPGSYSIRSRDNAFAQGAGRIVLESRGANATETYEGRYIGAGGLVVKGRLWVRGEVAYVEAASRRDGKWDSD